MKGFARTREGGKLYGSRSSFYWDESVDFVSCVLKMCFGCVNTFNVLLLLGQVKFVTVSGTNFTSMVHLLIKFNVGLIKKISL